MSAPEPATSIGSLKLQLVRIARWAALFSVAIAALALALVVQGDAGARAYRLIFAALGVGLAVLLGIALMGLLSLGRRGAHDEDPTAHHQKDRDDPRT